MVAFRSDAHVIAWEQRQLESLKRLAGIGLGFSYIDYHNACGYLWVYHRSGQSGGSATLRNVVRQARNWRERMQYSREAAMCIREKVRAMDLAADRSAHVCLNGKPLGSTVTSRYGGWYKGEYISEYTFGDRRENGVNVRVSYPMEMAQGTVSLHDGETPWYEYPENDWEYALPEARKDTRRTKRGKLRLV